MGQSLHFSFFQHTFPDYLLVEDYFSNFPLVRKLTSQTATYVESLLKIIFSEHSIPVYLFTGQERQFTSAEFQEFARCYQFEIPYSTPRFPQSNGFIKAMVKIVKETMNKAVQSGKTHILQC